jgi:hypothetical protein
MMGAMRTPSAPVLVGREREVGLIRGVLEQFAPNAGPATALKA